MQLRKIQLFTPPLFLFLTKLKRHTSTRKCAMHRSGGELLQSSSRVACDEHALHIRLSKWLVALDKSAIAAVPKNLDTEALDEIGRHNFGRRLVSQEPEKRAVAVLEHYLQTFLIGVVNQSADTPIVNFGALHLRNPKRLLGAIVQSLLGTVSEYGHALTAELHHICNVMNAHRTIEAKNSSRSIRSLYPVAKQTLVYRRAPAIRVALDLREDILSAHSKDDFPSAPLLARLVFDFEYTGLLVLAGSRQSALDEMRCSVCLDLLAADSASLRCGLVVPGENGVCAVRFVVAKGAGAEDDRGMRHATEG